MILMMRYWHRGCMLLKQLRVYGCMAGCNRHFSGDNFLSRKKWTFPQKYCKIKTATNDSPSNVSFMKRRISVNKKIIAIMALAACLTLGGIFSAYGQENTITSVSLSFSWDKAPKGGDIVGSITASSSSSQFKVEGTEYVKDDDTWIFGERPVAEVELSAREGYKFSNIERSDFSLSGCSAQYKESHIESDGVTLILQVYLPEISGNLPGTTATSWNGDTALWDSVDGSEQYEVKLYRDKRLLATVTTKENSYDFSSYINTEGSYTFNVRALGTYSTEASGWSSDSDAKVLNRENAWTRDNGEWQKTSAGWRFAYKDGTFATDCGRVINDTWYYFNYRGYMESDCYVKSDALEMYYWLGSDGAWMPEWDTGTPDRGSYRVVQ